MNDLISRRAAIDALMTWEEESAVWDEECIKHRGEPFWEAPSDIIEQLPSVQSELKWIPCSERLPEKAGEYLITKIRIGWNGQKYTELAVDYFYGDYGKEYGMVWKISKKVVAWMPIPIPYCGGNGE